MKKFTALLATVLCAAMLFSACTQAPSGSAGSANGAIPDVPKVCLLITGSLGDKSFFDSANEGLERVKQERGDKIVTKVVEVGSDQTKYEPALRQVSEADYDVIIVMGWIIVEHLQVIAPEHPEKTYILLDSSVDYEATDCSNVYSVEYKSNEASFLAGLMAARLTTSGEEGYDAQSLIGFIGAIDIPVINDFMVGYLEGAKYADPDVRCLISYVGNFDDSARAKELGITEFNGGADIIFAPCSAPTIGVIDAGYESGQKKVIGVHSDQAMLLEEISPEKAEIIPTSVLKNIGNSLYNALNMYAEGKLPAGQKEMHGLKEDGVGLAENKYYEKLVPEEIREEIKAVREKIISGEITVSSAYGMSADELNELRNSVK